MNLLQVRYLYKTLQKKTLSCTGLIYAITALGVAAGYMGGGLFLNLWVDIDKSEVDVDMYGNNSN